MDAGRRRSDSQAASLDLSLLISSFDYSLECASDGGGETRRVHTSPRSSQQSDLRPAQISKQRNWRRCGRRVERIGSFDARRHAPCNKMSIVIIIAPAAAAKNICTLPIGHLTCTRAHDDRQSDDSRQSTMTPHTSSNQQEARWSALSKLVASCVKTLAVASPKSGDGDSRGNETRRHARRRLSARLD